MADISPSNPDDVHAHANKASDLSTLFAPLLPRDQSNVGGFVAAAALALGRRSADLARIMGVGRATLSSWAARGSLPAEHAKWFSGELVPLVLSTKTDLHFSTPGFPAALMLFRATDFDPFGLPGLSDAARIEVCNRHLDGLARLALFVKRRLEWDHLDPDADAKAAKQVGLFAVAVAPRLFPAHDVARARTAGEALIQDAPRPPKQVHLPD